MKRDRVYTDSASYMNEVIAEKRPKQKSGVVARFLRRFFFVVFAVAIMLVSALLLILNLVFNGPSPTARNYLTMSLIEASATKWVPGLFLDDTVIAEIRDAEDIKLTDDVTDTSAIVINKDALISGENDEWADYPDGIR